MKVDDYIKKQKSPQKEILQKLRKIILKKLKVEEKMTYGVPWYEGKYYLVALKDHVNLGVSVKGMLKKDMKNFEGKGKLMRHKKFFSLKDINEKEVVKLLKMVKECGSCAK